jgi:hypothetical protein
MGAEANEAPEREGRCDLCGNLFSKRAMTKHIEACRKKNLPKARGRTKARQEKVYHLVVEGAGLPEYWLHLEAPASATLRDLDLFLRDIWLECCGHMSAFTIGKVRFSVSPLVEYEERGMNVPLGRVLCKGTKFYHEYDFGTTTVLLLKVVSETERLISNRSIQFLARNLAPDIPCDVCGKPAVRICCGCIQEGTGWLCDECARKHPCGSDMFLPVVNSPRTGMCGYSGR